MTPVVEGDVVLVHETCSNVACSCVYAVLLVSQCRERLGSLWLGSDDKRGSRIRIRWPMSQTVKDTERKERVGSSEPSLSSVYSKVFWQQRGE